MELSNQSSNPEVKEDHVEDMSRRRDSLEQNETVQSFVDAKELGFSLKKSKLTPITEAALTKQTKLYQQTEDLKKQMQAEIKKRIDLEVELEALKKLRKEDPKEIKNIEDLKSKLKMKKSDIKKLKHEIKRKCFHLHN